MKKALLGLAALTILTGCASSGPSPSYRAGYSDAQSGKAASFGKVSGSYHDACHYGLQFADPSIDSHDFLKGCSDALHASGGPNMFHPENDTYDGT